MSEVTTSKYTFEYISHRNIESNILKKYEIATKIDETGKPIEVAFPYSNGLKIRKLTVDKKESFSTQGDMKGPKLFGKNLFSAGSAKSITITEGEWDAPSAHQMLGGKYPAVSVSSATSAKKDCEANKEYLDSFERIYICFDNDEPGKQATKEVATLFHPSKVYIVNLTKYKDASDYLQNNEVAEFRNIWFNSQKYRPDEIISSYDEIDSVIDKTEINIGIPYPFPTLTEMTYGLRLGECTLFTALEGIGKTEILRAIEYSLIKTTTENIGIIHLEEDEARSIKGLVGYELQQPVHLPDSGIDNAKIKETYRSLTTSDDRVYFSSHFGSDDPDIILSTIRFLVAGLGCKFIFLDHISLVVSGTMNEDERQKLDYISTQLKMLCKELKFALIFISHVNDDGLTRGSRNISKIADTHIHLDRDKLNDDSYERNITTLTIKKNRFGSHTGFAGRLYFDPKTFIITEETPLSKETSIGLLPF